ncbi:MAG: hypothetical protein J5634_04705 [Bacilli bacterium]|nr:hypothetical protein [Bacilli bacterium]
MEEVKKKSQTKKVVKKTNSAKATKPKVTTKATAKKAETSKEIKPKATVKKVTKKVEDTKAVNEVTTETKAKVKKTSKATSKINKEVKDEVKVVEETLKKEEVKKPKDETIKEEKKEIVKTEKPKNKGKKALIFIIILLVLIIAGLLMYFLAIKKDNGGNSNPNNSDKPLKLPKPEVDDGERGKLGIDKNVNEKSIDKYLGRKDAVYRDMRMLEDPALYEEIGGDRYLSGYIDGFEVVPLPFIIPVKELPKEVGYTYNGTTLFFQTSDGKYHPMFEESMDIIEELFPKDKVIFLMCGGGRYAGMMKEFLVSQGWNKDKIYVVGGYWYYNGKNKVEVPKTGRGDNVTYDFSNVPYHDIDFSELTQIKTDRHTKNSEKFYLDDEFYNSKDEKFKKLVEKYETFFSSDSYTEMDDDEYDKLLEEYDKLEQEIVDYVNNLFKDKNNFVISVYSSNGCGDLSDSVAYRSDDYANEKNIYFYLVPSDIIMNSDVYKDVQEFPNVIIVKNKKVYTYLDYSSDDDTDIFESNKALYNWINKYIYISK